MAYRRDRETYGRDAQNRARIADVAARLIAEHGLSDWSLAKRKAARQLMLPERTTLPGDDEIESALAAHHALFGGEAHAAMLRGQREEALAWLQDLEGFEPTLVGGVAAGWATAHSDIRIELVADDSKGVELSLINRNVSYRVAPGVAQHTAPELLVDTARGRVRLIVRTRFAARQRRRNDVRMDAVALRELLANEGPRSI
ncbi:MAG TPA: hypothetical protein VL654_15025 [Casimicrobiaceae bacterium]|jgi:hypothetical protein|nr:hypothetical protein [Casimicrobiaceae bacterium]